MHSSAEVQTGTEPGDAGRFIAKPNLGWKGWGCFVAVVLLLQILVMDLSVGVYDEGLSLYGALRVLHGQLPYRDFWTMYGPGEFYVLAGFFRAFGVYALWGRVFFLLANTLSMAAIFYVLDELFDRRWLSLGATSVILLWLSSVGSYEFPVYPALTLILVAMALMMRRWQLEATRDALYAGIALGFAALFRHDLALYGLVALGVASVVYALTGRGKGMKVGVAEDVVKFIAGSLLIVVPVTIALLLAVPAHDLYYGLFYVPARVYPKVRAMPFPGFHQVFAGFRHLGRFSRIVVAGDAEFNIVWFPVLVGLTALAGLVPLVRRGVFERWRGTMYTALLLVTALLFLKGIVRVAPLHMLQAVVPAMMLFACLAFERRRMVAFSQWMLGFTALWLALCFVGTLHHDFHYFRVNLSLLHGADGGETVSSLWHPQPGLERARGLMLEPEEQQAILYLEEHTLPTEKIFVGSDRHDELFANDISLYFISARDSATKWHDLHPGVETTAPIQREMITDLERNRAAYVVREPNQAWEPNGSSVSSGVMLLDDYINSNYKLDRSFGDIKLLRRDTPF